MHFYAILDLIMSKKTIHSQVNHQKILLDIQEMARNL